MCSGGTWRAVTTLSCYTRHSELRGWGMLQRQRTFSTSSTRSGFSFSNYIFLCCGKKENLLITRFIVDARFMHIKWILSGADFEADVAGVGGEAWHVPSLDVVGDVLPSFARVFAVKTLERILHLDHAVLHVLAEVRCCHPSWQWQEATDETHWYRMQK